MADPTGGDAVKPTPMFPAVIRAASSLVPAVASSITYTLAIDTGQGSPLVVSGLIPWGFRYPAPLLTVPLRVGTPVFGYFTADNVFVWDAREGFQVEACEA